MKHFFEFLAGDGIWMIAIEEVETIQFTKIQVEKEIPDPKLVGKKMKVKEIVPAYIVSCVNKHLTIVSEEAIAAFTDFLQKMQNEKVISIYKRVKLEKVD